VLSATGSFTVTGDTFGSLGSLLPGQGLDQNPFRRLIFTDTSGGANTLQVLVAGSNFIDDRITGTVEVIDAAANRTLSGQGFSVQSQVAAAVGFFSNAMLINSSTDKRIRIDRMMVSADAVGLIAAGVAGNPGGFTFNMAGANKLAAGASASGNSGFHIRNNSAVDHLAGATKLQFSAYAPANTAIDVRFTYPVVLTPGYALIVRPGNFNVSLNVWAEFVEETM
jgi:hypothetical protein